MISYKRRILFFFVLCILVTTSSCSSSPSVEEEGVTVIRLPELPKTLEECDTLLYTDMYSEVRYVPLLLHSDVLLSTFVGRTEMLPHQEMIVFSDHTNQIVRFDSTGHYINHIGCVGKAANEYSYPIDIAYDKFNNRVIVFDNPGDLYFYHVDGTFINKVHIPWYIGKLSVLSKDRLIIEKPIGDGKNTCDFCVITEAGEVVSRFFPYDNPDSVIDSQYQFFQDGDKNYCHKIGSNVVYEILPDTLLPAFCLIAPSQKTDWMKKNIERRKAMEEHMKGKVSFEPIEVSETLQCQYFTKMGNVYYFTVSDNVTTCYGLYDDCTKECKLYGSFMNDVMKWVPLSMSYYGHVSQGYHLSYYVAMPLDDYEEWEANVPDSIRQKFPLQLVESSFAVAEVRKWKE